MLADRLASQRIAVTVSATAAAEILWGKYLSVGETEAGAVEGPYTEIGTDFSERQRPPLQGRAERGGRKDPPTSKM